MRKHIYTTEVDKPPNEDVEPPGNMSVAFKLSLISPIPPVSKSPPISNDIAGQSVASFPVNEKARLFRDRFFPYVPEKEWNNWRWQLKHRIIDMETLKMYINLSDDEEKFFATDVSAFPISITPYYLSLIDPDDPGQPLRKAVVPVFSERLIMDVETEDPLGEDLDSPVPGIVHRYPDRVLFLVTNFCSTFCRYCTRSRLVSKETEKCNLAERWDLGIEYIKNNPAIRDVLVSGGDPLTLPDERIEWILSRLRDIDHVEIIRIGTKIPAVLPQRVTGGLLRILKKYHPLYINIHAMHPDELTPEMKAACARLADAGIPLGSQTVLLAGINDDSVTMRALMQGLLKTRVKPYYLYQCDLVPGSSHFRTPVEKGLEIIEGLRGHTTGMAVPHYVIDAPNGGGKIPLLPDYCVAVSDKHYVLRNYKHNTYVYPDRVC
ncbi:MAG: KamA family radical SAM protein [Spirochaetales bacterium]|nr:KamA family radical SAM protein [Spirochaetales bacterium]